MLLIVQVAGNQGRGKDISTIVNADKEEKAQAEAAVPKEEVQETVEGPKSEKESDEDYKVEKEDDEEGDEEDETIKTATRRKLLARKKHRKLNSLDISSEEDDPYSDEDFKGSDSDEDEEDFDEQLSSSDDSDMAGRRRGKRGDPRAVRRSTRARQTRYDEDFSKCFS